MAQKRTCLLLQERELIDLQILIVTKYRMKYQMYNYAPLVVWQLIIEVNGWMLYTW